ncbi:MAG: MBL fold metallo-hydrolase [Syntrophorhabdales bacterium]|jgi:glyoxylase-like metal-dependent hydrolase (beta-lactamase superfamily II)
MIFGTTGPLTDDFYALGLAWSPVYLLNGKRPVLFEAGFACGGRIYAEAIRSFAQRQPEILFLTHVHWDHCGAAGYLKEAFPGLAIAASGRASRIVERPNARELMRTLSENVKPLVARLPGVDEAMVLDLHFQPFEVDMTLEGGQIIELDEYLSVAVMATPGHTRDHLSYYIPEKRILIATEASGVLDRAGAIITEFLVDYDAYLSSLKRLAALPVDILCQGHHFVFVGADEVRSFFSRSLSEAERFRDRVYRLLEATGGSAEEVVRQIKAEQWDSNTSVKQAETAYLLNLRTQVAHLAEKLRKSGGLG